MNLRQMIEDLQSLGEALCGLVVYDDDVANRVVLGWAREQLQQHLEKIDNLLKEARNAG